MAAVSEFTSWGAALRAIRRVERRSQSAMADALGITQGALSQLETGQTAQPSAETLAALKSATGWDVYKRGDVVHIEREGARMKPTMQDMSDVIVPVLNQDVRAGDPMPVIDDRAEMFNVTRHYRDTMVVRVSGDSMTGAGIEDGDKLVVKHTDRWRDGDCVLAMVGGEYILKRAYRADGSVRFVPANDAYEERVYPAADIAVLGVVIEIIRRFK